MVRAERGPTLVRLRGTVDPLAGRARAEECADRGRELFGFLTTEANAIVAPIHSKAMPVILTTTEEFDLWLEGETVEALKLQRPLPDGMLDIVARGEKEDGAVEAELFDRWRERRPIEMSDMAPRRIGRLTGTGH
jgi:putative SOS response-associated peptidase YedK